MDLDETNIYTLLLSVHRLLKKHGNEIQKYFSHFGAIRIAPDEFRMASQNCRLKAYYVVHKMLPSSTPLPSYMYLCLLDMGNAYYAGWVLSMAKRPQICKDFGTENQEVLGDIVEAALGICYLCTIFPEQLHFVMRKPNTMWRRMETSMLQHTPTSTEGLAKKRGGTVTFKTPESVLELSRTLQENPILRTPLWKDNLRVRHSCP
jgi:hypothetical protein